MYISPTSEHQSIHASEHPSRWFFFFRLHAHILILIFLTFLISSSKKKKEKNKKTRKQINKNTKIRIRRTRYIVLLMQHASSTAMDACCIRWRAALVLSSWRTMHIVPCTAIVIIVGVHPAPLFN